MNGNDQFVKQLQDVARTPGVERIDVKGVYYDRRSMQGMTFRRAYTTRQITDGAIDFPENLNADFVAIVRIRNAGLPRAISVVDELDRRREQAGLAPLPFRWVCESTRSVPGGTEYRCLPGEART